MEKIISLCGIKRKNTDGQGDLFTSNNFTYRAIMTNNTKMSDLEIIEFFNKRGDSERLFDEMNNDFLWEKCHFLFFLIIKLWKKAFYHLRT